MAKKSKKTGKDMVVAAVGGVEEKRLRMTRNKIKTLKRMGGEFKKDLPNIFELIDNNADSRQIQIAYYKAALAVVVDMIPVMENKAQNSKWDRDILALNSLLEQGMSILANIQALDETKQVAFRIANNIIEPAYNSLAHTYVLSMAMLRDDVMSHVRQEDEMSVRNMFHDASKKFGSYLDTSKISFREALSKEIS